MVMYWSVVKVEVSASGRLVTARWGLHLLYFDQ